MSKIVLASTNAHKIAEFKVILAPLGLELLSLADFPPIEIIENGATFTENSLIKAQAVFNATHLPTLADDSGLAVDFLNGAPGIHSARYSGVDGPGKDLANRQKLLAAMSGVPMDKRQAAFHCVLTLIEENGTVHSFDGACHGHIHTEEMGDNGFGYDPIFIPDGYDKSFALLDGEVKNRLSHRGRATSLLIEYLKNL